MRRVGGKEGKGREGKLGIKDGDKAERIKYMKK